MLPILLCAVLQTSQTSEYRLEAGLPDISLLGSLNASAIVSPAHRLPTQTREGFAERSCEFNADQVRVVDGISYSRGLSVTAVAPLQGPTGRGAPYPMQTLEASRNYLLLARKPRGGRLFLPHDNPIDQGPELSMPSNSESEALALAVFETERSVLSNGPSDADRIFNSVIDCLVDSSDANLRAVTAFLSNSYYPGFTKADFQGHADTPASLRLKTIASTATTYQKAKIYQVLNRWGVWGSDIELARAYVACLRDSTAFQTPPESIPETNEITFRGNPRLPAGYSLPGELWTDNQWAEAMATAQNRTVRDHFLQGEGQRPDREHQRMLSVLLSDPEEAVRVFICKHYADSFAMPDHAPHAEEVLRNGERVRIYRDLAQQVEFWRDYIATILTPGPRCSTVAGAPTAAASSLPIGRPSSPIIR